MNQVVVRSRKSWFARIRESVGGAFVGILMILVAVGVLFWNEGRAVKRAADLAFGKGQVVTIDPGTVDPAHEGKLVHFTGKADVEAAVADEAFAFEDKALQIRRIVQMYQWEENKRTQTRDRVGGGQETITTYDYRKTWSERALDSSRFHESGKHQNPPMPYESETFVNPAVHVGKYMLSSRYVEGLQDFRIIKPKKAQLEALPKSLQERAQIADNEIYIGDPGSPSVGDLRIQFQVVRPLEGSFVGMPQQGTLVAFEHERLHGSIALVDTGRVQADAMFQAAEDANVMMTWGLRLLGFILMFIGFGALFKPFSILAAFIPPLGKLVGCATNFGAFLLAASISLFVIAIAWLFYRPLLAIALFTIGAGLMGGIIFLIIKNREKRPATAT